MKLRQLILLAGVLAGVGVRAEALEYVHDISVQNVIGVHCVQSEAEYTALAVCFGETCVTSNVPGNLVRYATNLVFTANLLPGDRLFVFDHGRNGYATYELNDKLAWDPQTTFSTKEDGDFEPVADQSQAWGYGFWLYRKNLAARADKNIWLAGQVPIGAVTVTLAATDETLGQTLIGNPLGSELDMNDKSLVDWSKAETGAHVYMGNAATNVQADVFWKKGDTWINATSKSALKVPAGHAFWFVRGATGTKETTLEFRTGL